MEFQTVPVLGCPIAAIDYRAALSIVRERAEARTGPYLVEAANTHVVAMARHDPEFRKSMNAFDLWTPDGMPLVWSANRGGRLDPRMKDRVYGPTLMIEAVDQLGSFRHFLLGGSEEMLEKLRQNLMARNPGLNLVGSHAPPFGDWDESEDERICEHLRASDAQLVWVGLGCPKQEHWLARMKPRLPNAVYFGIGAAFAFHAGLVKQAPKWIQNRGLEWAYRLAREPRRLVRRYLKYNSLFVYYLLRDKLLRRPDTTESS